MDEVESGSGIEVTFHPQEWVDSPGLPHEIGHKQLVPADSRKEVSFYIPWEDGTDPSDGIFEDESYEANQLRHHRAAPAWVNDWDGAYFVTLDPE